MKFVKTMKVLQKFLSVVFLCIFFSACDDPINIPTVPEQNGMVSVHIGLSDISSRSVMPNVPSEEGVAFYYLYGTSSTNTDAQEVLLSKFNGNLDGASVLLKPGRWNFTLEACDDNGYPVLKGVRKNIDISVGYSATVHFSLRPIDDPLYEGTASIVIELPDGINISMVETTINGIILEPPLEIEDGIINFYNIMAAGDYLVHFFLKDSEDRALAVISEMLVIRGGLESTAIITLRDVDFNHPPASPGNFRVTAYTDGNLVFGWERNSWNETGFVLNDGTADYVIEAGHTSYILAYSNPIGKKFTFYAANDFGESSKLEYKVALPGTPIGMAAEALSSNSIVVSWQAADGAETYTVQRAEASGGPYTVIAAASDTVFIDNGLSFSTTYYYRVIANSMFGSSPVSNVVSAETMSLFGSEDNPFLLTAGVWTNGDIETEDGRHWYIFIATSGTQYIHVDFGALNDVYVQVYNNTGNAVGSETRLSGNTRSFSLTLSSGQQYYIRVRPNSNGSGTYRIGYNTSVVPPATVLAESIWADGYIIPAVGEQWFTFTATAETQYIHVEFGTLTDLYVRVDNSGNVVGNETRFTGDTMSTLRSLTAGQQYSIRVRPYSSGGSGTYKIAFNTSFVPPDVTVTTLTANTWADGNIARANGTQWFMFTATAATQYIHVEIGAFAPVYVRVYDNSGNAAGNETALSGATTSISRTLSTGQQYYIRVRSNSSGSGTYRIAFNTSFAPPNVTTLTANNWANSNITANGSQWFTFTATAAEQYIHVEFGTLTDVYVCMYDNSGAIVTSGGSVFIPVEREKRLNSNTNITFFSRSVTAGQQYYIQVWPYSANDSGTYKIAFNASFVPPGVTVTTLVANNWANGNIAANGSQWFRFTATAETQYIHVEFATLTDMYVRVYDNSGAIVGYSENTSGIIIGGNNYGERETRLRGSTTVSLSRSVTAGQQYYVQVWPYSATGSGTYRITFNALIVPPGAVVLTANTWADGYIAEGGGSRWFTFTATAATQYIHAASVDSVASMLSSVRVYDNSGNAVGSGESISNTFFSRSLTVGQQYYICVTTSSFADIGGMSFKISFNTSPAPPGTITLTANTWADGNIEEGGAQWFRFTATAVMHYIHVELGTLPGYGIQVYNNSGNAVGSETTLSSLTNGQQYYIRVRTGLSSGTYRIAFNTSVAPPGITATALTANTWANGNIPSSGAEQWFRFTATARTQYIHFDLYGTLSELSNVNIYVYDNSTNANVEIDRLVLSLSCSVTSGRQYLIRVYTDSSYGPSGTYRIAFNASATPPAITLPQTDVTTLTLNTWANGNIPSSHGTQWFRFTATAARQFIHVDFGTPSSLDVQVYDNSGILTKGERTNFNGFASITYSLVSGRQYYIRARMMGSAVGTYRILFNTSVVSPIAAVTALTTNTWVDVTGTPQWFRFTATAGTQYIHGYGYIYAQVYDNNSNAVGSELNFAGTDYSPLTITAGQQYYIRAYRYDFWQANNYKWKIAVNASTTPPP
jgi:hypothetical protein